MAHFISYHSMGAPSGYEYSIHDHMVEAEKIFESISLLAVRTFTEVLGGLIILLVLVRIKVSRSRNMKQKVYKILTYSKIQTNDVILNNCKD